MLNIKELSKYLDFSIPTIKRLIEDKGLPTYQFNKKGRLRFKKAEIDQWMRGFKKNLKKISGNSENE